MSKRNTQNPQQQALYSASTLEVVVLAREYCARLTDSGTASGGGLTDWLYSFLPLLFYKVTRMPRLPLLDGCVDLSPALTEAEYESLRIHLSELLSHRDSVALPLTDRDLTLLGASPTLSEAVADLYQALYDMLYHYRDGEEGRMYSALADFQAYFYESWGDKLLLCLRELHQRHAQSCTFEEEGLYV